MDTAKVATTLVEKREDIIQRWLKKVVAHPVLAAVPLTPVLRRDHAGLLLAEIADRLRGRPSLRVSDPAVHFAQERLALGYTPEMEAIELALMIEAADEVLAEEHDANDRLAAVAELLGLAHRALETAVRASGGHEKAAAV